MNRAAKQTFLFSTASEYAEFERLLEAALSRVPMRILAYCLMPTHWHLLLWPHGDGDVSRFIKWLGTTHASHWNVTHGTVGRGAVYQSRFKSSEVEDHVHLLRVWRYIERNALRGNLVVRAEDWRWCSMWRRMRGPYPHYLNEVPVALPEDWVDVVNTPATVAEKRGLTPVPVRGSDP